MTTASVLERDLTARLPRANLRGVLDSPARGKAAVTRTDWAVPDWEWRRVLWELTDNATDFSDGTINPASDHTPYPTHDTSTESDARHGGKSDDDVTRLLAVLADMGVSDHLARALADTATGCALVQGQLRDGAAAAGPAAEVSGGDAPEALSQAKSLLTAIESITSTTARLDGVLLDATRHLTAAHGKILLADKGAASVEELTHEQTRRWRARAKSLTRHEISALTGIGTGEVMDLVALANSPHAVTAPIRSSLADGTASWRLARRYHRACAGLKHQDAAAIADALFGTDLDTAVTERLTATGQWTHQPWHHKKYYRALDREVASVKARDAESTSRDRSWSLANSDVFIGLDEHGIGTVSIRTTATHASAIAARIETAARIARKHGDRRNLGQLRAALSTALLLHGGIDLSELPDDPALITVEHTEALTRILHGLPPAILNVIVPLNALIPSGAATPLKPTSPPGETSPPAEARAPGEANPPGGAHPSCAAGQPDTTLEPVDIGEVTGPHPHFLSAPELRELALAPGTTLHRLLTDPATGRCVERSTTAYRFDADMRAQILAADHTCRAPGCTVAGSFSQIDHVQEFGTPGGHTCEANGALLHTGHHDLKTQKHWDSTINANREITWTTLLGRIYRTKAHDYRQYTALLTQATATIEATPETDRAEAIDRAIYAALSYRDADTPLEVEDDYYEPDNGFAWDYVTLTHTDDNGERRYRPHPDIAAAERQRHETTRPPEAGPRPGGPRPSEQGISGEGTAGQGTAGQGNAAPGNDTPWGESDPEPPPF